MVSDASRRRDCGSRSGPRWFVFRSHPRAETAAALRLQAQGFESYVPMVARQLRIGTLIAPLFPRYGFVRFDALGQRWRAIHSTPGVQKLFSASPETPTPVPAGLVEAIKAGEAERLVIADIVPAFIAAGAAVHVTDGPFVGANGLCRWAGKDRARVLLQIMGRNVAAELPRNHVAPD